jgi:diguanylate cyclase (GGDEF)-like protein
MEDQKVKRVLAVVLVIWILVVGSSLFWNVSHARDDHRRTVLHTARAFFDLLVVTRSWNSGHNGVYVPVTEDTQPNPHLTDPLRDITVNDNLTLTKVNPAFMTRQIGELVYGNWKVRFHITSLNPIRPANEASTKEETALQSFEEGHLEEAYFFNNDGIESYFYMAPLLTKSSCLKCHADQGYKEGDVRGGISVTIPLLESTGPRSLILGHLAIGAIGVLAILLLGMRLGRAYDTIQLQSTIDSLTGLMNRRSLTIKLSTEFGRSKRAVHSGQSDRDLSLIMIDVDHFKRFNDQYGHLDGDECLRVLAETMQQSLQRPGEFCARFGGEEFLVVLPETHLQGAKMVALRIQNKVAKLAIPHADSPTSPVVTVSLGVSSLNSDPVVSADQLIQRADEALYQAKQQGRNRVVTR